MRIVNLVENTEGASGCAAAHGLSFYIETPSHRLLVDAGPSDLIIENAARLGVDLGTVDTVVLSHGHYDHSDGLPAFARMNPNARIFMRRTAAKKYMSVIGGLHYIGMEPSIEHLPQVAWVDGCLDIDGELSLFGDIHGRRRWPGGNRSLLVEERGECTQDTFDHEQCLVIREGGRRVLLSGCAHSGILNILDRFAELYGGAPDAVISGFHMMKQGDHDEGERSDILATAEELMRLPTRFYTCHCTGLPAFDLMKSVMGDKLRYVHSGDIIEL